MQEFILTGLLGAVLISICCLNVYEALRHIWKWLSRVTGRPRLRILMVVWLIFIAHILNIWLYGFVYYFMHKYSFGTLSGGTVEQGKYALDSFGCIYFSAVIYSTLGLGDLTPIGALRMIAGAEALTGFILIGWTVSFTYLAMEKFWALPHHRHHKPPSRNTYTGG